MSLKRRTTAIQKVKCSPRTIPQHLISARPVPKPQIIETQSLTYEEIEETEILPHQNDSTIQLSPSSSLSKTILYRDHRPKLMLTIASFVRTCNASTEAVTIQPFDEVSGHPRFAEWFRPYMSALDEMMVVNKKAFDDYYLGEEIACFFNARSLLDIEITVSGLYEHYKPQSLLHIESRARAINQFCQSIREQMNLPEVKYAIQSRIRQCDSNLKSCRELIEGCFEYFGKVTILRIDFGFKIPEKIVNSLYHANDLKHEFHSSDKLELLKRHINQLLNNCRHNSELNKIEAHIIKFEHGIKKGYHAHALFVLNANEYQNDGFYAHLITKYWEQITNGTGCTYNCHMAKNKYKRLCIGKINHTEIDKRIALDQCLQYFCKQSQAFMFRPLKTKYRSIQISSIPRRRSNAGRPRINQCRTNLIIHEIKKNGGK